MTPAARVQAAIEVLDAILAGAAAEQALSRWTRSHRFAGSKDRAALRDLVFDALRCRSSFAAMGGGLTGRGLMIGRCIALDQPLSSVFDGQGYGPAALTETEEAALTTTFGALAAPARHDMPEWLLPGLSAAYGPALDDICQTLRGRAPVDLRVNMAKGSRAEAADALAREGISSTPVPEVSTALRVGEGARKVVRSAAYLNGRVELQDAASQACVLGVPMPEDGGRILDYCAGGGGKALALAARTRAKVFVHDISTARMQDIPVRAARAGVSLPVWSEQKTDRFDMVFCDAPCSGSGTWRRTPEAKWALTEARLDTYIAAQRGVLSDTRDLVRPGGHLVYATCSLLVQENADQLGWFLSSFEGFELVSSLQMRPGAPGDGFFYAVFRKAHA